MAQAMVRRALRAGIEAQGMCWRMLRYWQQADAPDGGRGLISGDPAHEKERDQYRRSEFQQGQMRHRDCDVRALYRAGIRGHWDQIPGQPYQAKAVAVELNLSESPQDP